MIGLHKFPINQNHYPFNKIQSSRYQEASASNSEISVSDSSDDLFSDNDFPFASQGTTLIYYRGQAFEIPLNFFKLDSLKYLFEQYDFSDFQNFDSSTDRLFNLLPGKEVKEKSEIIMQLSSNPEDNPNFYRGNHPLELIKEMHANKYFTFVLIIRIIKNNSKKFKK